MDCLAYDLTKLMPRVTITAGIVDYGNDLETFENVAAALVNNSRQ